MMRFIERTLIEMLLWFTDAGTLYDVLGDARLVAILVGGLVAVSGALLGTYLVLRGMSLTSDAISHTVLLGIVVSFLILTRGLNQPPDLSSPWLIIGATASGVLTVFLTEVIYKSGLVKEDAALGLAFPFLFAIAVIMINQYVANTHLDTDAVLVGEIGLAFGDTNEYCFEHCEPVTITPDHPRAETRFRCVNCVAEGDGPRTCRDAEAICEEYCYNCRTYSAAEAYAQRLTDVRPLVVLWPKALTVMGLITLLNALFVVGLYKELKLVTFDEELAAALGFRPGLLHYLLMTMVSITAVGAFDAVGAILVIAFFIVPPAAAYLLTDRLWLVLVLSVVIGVLGAWSGYDLARGTFLGIEGSMQAVLRLLDRTVGLDGYTEWNTSPGASMVMMLGFFFLVVWVISPRYGLVSGLVRRADRRRQFAEQMVLAHIANHQDTPRAAEECRVATLPAHLNWSPAKTQRIIQRLRLRQLVRIEDGQLHLTPRGTQQVNHFRAERLART